MKAKPEEIHDVSRGMFSIARYYGAIVFNECRYTYDAQRDVLVRDDVLKARKKEKKKEQKQEKKAKKLQDVNKQDVLF